MPKIRNPFALRVPTVAAQKTSDYANYSYQSFVREVWSINATNKQLFTRDNVNDAWEKFVDRLANGDQSKATRLMQQALGPDANAVWAGFNERLRKVSTPGRSNRTSELSIPALRSLPLERLTYSNWVQMVKRENPGIKLCKDECDRSVDAMFEALGRKESGGARRIEKERTRLTKESKKYWASKVEDDEEEAEEEK